MVINQTIIEYVNALLAIDDFKDYAPNGLQVEGKQEVRKIITGVTASLALLEAAVAKNADMILVHHGYFWPNEDARIVGMKKRRLALLLKHEINLLGYHLPLDAHAEFGNNVQLGRQLGLNIEGFSGKYNLIAYASSQENMTKEQLRMLIDKRLERKSLMVGPQEKTIKKIAWCTGAAQNYIQHAIDIRADAFISGEISEQTTHIAEENQIIYVAAGHHATERYGIEALGKHLAEKFAVEHEFVDIFNPV